VRKQKPRVAPDSVFENSSSWTIGKDISSRTVKASETREMIRRLTVLVPVGVAAFYLVPKLLFGHALSGETPFRVERGVGGWDT
jgi:hypothetical protein